MGPATKWCFGECVFLKSTKKTWTIPVKEFIFNKALG